MESKRHNHIHFKNVPAYKEFKLMPVCKITGSLTWNWCRRRDGNTQPPDLNRLYFMKAAQWLRYEIICIVLPANPPRPVANFQADRRYYRQWPVTRSAERAGTGNCIVTDPGRSACRIMHCVHFSFHKENLIKSPLVRPRCFYFKETVSSPELALTNWNQHWYLRMNQKSGRLNKRQKCWIGQLNSFLTRVQSSIPTPYFLL